MQDSRIGEALWDEWSGYDFETSDSTSHVFYTIEHVEISDELVKRALASAIQRAGIVDSLGQAFKVVESASKIHGYAGELDGDTDYTACDESGETIYGDFVDEILPVTWVEISVR